MPSPHLTLTYGGRLNAYLLSLLLGIVEGLTEFLPVSSTAHLRIAESLLHVSLSDGYWKMYSIVIQLGAILCLPVYFRDRIAKFLSTYPGGEQGDKNPLTHPLRRLPLHFPIHVYHRQRPTRRHVPRFGSRILLLPLHAHHARRHRLHAVEIPPRQRRKPHRSLADHSRSVG